MKIELETLDIYLNISVLHFRDTVNVVFFNSKKTEHIKVFYLFYFFTFFKVFIYKEWARHKDLFQKITLSVNLHLQCRQ